MLSVRQIGEGHRSSVGFRHGVFGRDGRVSIDRRGPFTTSGHVTEDVALDAALFRDLASDPASESARWVLGGSGRAVHLAPARRTPARAGRSAGHAPRCPRHRVPVHRTCRAVLRHRVPVLLRVERTRAHSVLRGRVQRHRGRPVRAFRRRRRHRHLLRHLHGVRRRGDPPAAARDDGLPERSRPRPSLGHAAGNKGLALFPRAIDGAFYALSRHDGAAQLRRPIRRHAPLADFCSARREPIASGTASRSATADLRSSSTRDGWS